VLLRKCGEPSSTRAFDAPTTQVADAAQERAAADAALKAVDAKAAQARAQLSAKK